MELGAPSISQLEMSARFQSLQTAQIGHVNLVRPGSTEDQSVSRKQASVSTKMHFIFISVCRWYECHNSTTPAPPSPSPGTPVSLYIMASVIGALLLILITGGGFLCKIWIRQRSQSRTDSGQSNIIFQQPFKVFWSPKPFFQDKIWPIQRIQINLDLIHQPQVMLIHRTMKGQQGNSKIHLNNHHPNPLLELQEPRMEQDQKLDNNQRLRHLTR